MKGFKIGDRGSLKWRNYAVIGCVEPNASDDHFGNTDCANMNVVLPFLQALKGEEHELWYIGFFDQLERINNKAIEYNLSRWDNKFFKALLSKHTKRRIKKNKQSFKNLR